MLTFDFVLYRFILGYSFVYGPMPLEAEFFYYFLFTMDMILIMGIKMKR